MNTPVKKRKSLNYSLAHIVPSKTQLVLMLALHAAAILATGLAALPFIVQQLLIIGLAVSIAYACHCWRSAPAKRFTHQDGCWTIVSKDYKEAVIACHYWSHFCVVLIVENPQVWRKQYRPIFWDACSADNFRHIKLVSRYALNNQ